MFNLIQLPYSIDALEPVISARTLEFHHGKHLKGYVDNLNKLIAGTQWEGISFSAPELVEGRSEESILADIIRNSDGAIFNNAGQILNHNMYFEQFKPVGEPVEPPVPELVEGPLMLQIKKQWGSLESFQSEFVAKGVGLFGSGWVWLSAKEDGSLVITQEPGASNPVVKGLKPLLTFDVWEHAYYLDYQNRRADHLSALWKIINWRMVEGRFQK